RRVGRTQLMRNAAIALGNSGNAGASEHLERALTHNANATVRAHAAWALGRLATPESVAALRNARGTEQHQSVLEEINLALGNVESTASLVPAEPADADGDGETRKVTSFRAATRA
ncbi:MAG TPA: HEAT repeat domain-containing protein, partial [Polyangiaceae bacterium]